MPQARKWVTQYVLTCKTCNETKNWTYTSDLDDKYTKNTIDAVPFKKISIDIL